MERLTNANHKEIGFYSYCGPQNPFKTPLTIGELAGFNADYSPRKILEDILGRLAAYEDTGLEPEEVVQTKLALMGKVLAEIKEFEGIHADRMIELAQAEKDGRLVVLPCKVGDFVFDIADVTCYATQFLSFNISDGMIACRTVSSYPMVSDFGSRVFLTRQEAEAALREADENA